MQDIQEIIDKLAKLDCDDDHWKARQYVAKFADWQTCWETCPRADWMLRLLGRLRTPHNIEGHKKLALCACKCARLVLPYVVKGDARPQEAIEAAEKWVREKGSLESVRLAAKKALIAFNDANIAEGVTRGSYLENTETAEAAYAAYAAAHAATSPEADNANITAVANCAVGTNGVSYKQLADIVREFYPEAPEL